MATGRGTLRIYLGFAPGVGKTYAMLGEGHRRAERGTDVVIAVVETHGRAHTAAMVGDLEVVPRREFRYRGTSVQEMDVDAVLARSPDVVCVDELAHTNVPGSRNEKRWQDVEELLAAGVTVITTVNVQHLESLNDVVAKITGVRQRETVPDAVVRAAQQVDLVDLAPEALRRRMAHGNIYPAERVDAALSHYFREGNLNALRELALLWLADKVEVSLQAYRRDHGIDETWATRERVVVAITGGLEGETLIRRAARIAGRGGAELLAVHISASDGLSGASPVVLADQRRLVESLGGSYHEVIGDDVSRALLDFARGENATQLVVGASRRRWLAALLNGPGIGATTVRQSGDIDVHMVSHGEVGRGRRLPALHGGLTAARRIAGVGVAAVLLTALTLVLDLLRPHIDLTTDVLLYLTAVVSVSIVGGLWPSLAAAVAGSLLLNYYFTPPVHTFTISQTDNVIALVVFIVVAVLVSVVVDLGARRTSQAARASAESQTLATLAATIVRGEDAVPALLDRVRETLSLTTAALLVRDDGSEQMEVVATSSGSAPPDRRPAADRPADAQASVDERVVLVGSGRTLPAADQRVLAVFAAQAAAILDHQRLSAAVAAAEPVAAADRLRTALLAAVSHDLRSPLASATAAVESLRERSVPWTDEQRDELLATAGESLVRLTRLVENLLDMSRLQAGALDLALVPARLDEVVPLAVDGLAAGDDAVVLDIPEDTPEVVTDPGLLERVTANVVANALRHSPVSMPPVVTASVHGGRVELRVIDHGPGVRASDWDRMFTPFQRLGDTDNSTGTGLGLALARGLTEAMGGELAPEDTPGGGLTMVVSLPLAGVVAGPGPGDPDGGDMAASLT